MMLHLIPNTITLVKEEFPSIYSHICKNAWRTLSMVIYSFVQYYVRTKVTQNNTDMYPDQRSQQTFEILKNNLDVRFDRANQKKDSQTITYNMPDKRTR